MRGHLVARQLKSGDTDDDDADAEREQARAYQDSLQPSSRP